MTEKQKNKVQILYDWANGEYDSIPKYKMLHFIAEDTLRDIAALVDKGYKKVLSTQVVIEKSEYEALLNAKQTAQKLQSSIEVALNMFSSFIDDESSFTSEAEVDLLLNRVAQIFQKIKKELKQ